MTQQYYSLITNNGLLKEAAANAPGGSAIELTHIAVGDANGTSYNPTGAQTALVHEVYRTILTHVAIDESNPNQLIVEGVISEEVGPFEIREVGIFDSEGELFAIGKYPETFKSTSAEGSGKRLYIRLILGFTNAPQVELVLSEDLNNDPNFNANVIIALGQKLAKAANLSDVEDAEEARENLGLKIGVNVQAFAANLAAFAALVGAAKKVPYFTGAGQLAMADLFSNKNAIINGDFNIWQRGSSFANIANDVFSADRWRYEKNSAVVHTISRSTDVPTTAQAGRLFNYSLLADCTTVDASIASGDYCLLTQKIEGYNWLPFAQKAFTLSFWVKATKTGTYCAAFRNSGTDKSYVAEYTINQSDTWEFKTISVPASPSLGTWNYTNGVGLWLSFTIIGGSTFQTTANIWQSGNYFSTSNQVNGGDNTLNDFKICGVQLEAGSVATPFERRSFQEELELCQRYYEKSYNLETPPGTNGGAAGLRQYAHQAVTGAGYVEAHFPLITRKRANPTFYLWSSDGAVNNVMNDAGGNMAASIGGNESQYNIAYTNTGGRYGCNHHFAADAEL